MFPKPTLLEKILRKEPNVYGFLEHTFYAYKDNSDIKVTDFWDLKKRNNITKD